MGGTATQPYPSTPYVNIENGRGQARQVRSRAPDILGLGGKALIIDSWVSKGRS